MRIATGNSADGAGQISTDVITPSLKRAEGLDAAFPDRRASFSRLVSSTPHQILSDNPATHRPLNLRPRVKPINVADSLTERLIRYTLKR